MLFKQVDSSIVLPLRSLVLRPGLGLENAMFDKDKTALHFALMDEGACVACVTIYPEANKDLPGSKQWRLRGMAVSPEIQGKSLGTKLLKYLFNELEIDCDLIWCNARRNALSFYEKNDFQVVGNEFDILGVGPHKIAYRSKVCGNQ